jgi:3-hydroxyisobutyrate dehydrogenase
MSVIAFIGLGHMGRPMAANLVKAGHQVLGCDLDPVALDAAKEAGVTPVAAATEAVAKAEIVITMLVAGKQVVSLYRDSLVAAAKPGTLFIDCSTIDVASARTAHEAARAKGMATVDAPVSGGVGGATAATLTFMAGGAGDAVARARPVLEKMGKKVVHCGDAGAGQAAKICNNMILGISMIAVSEAFVLGEKLGLSHQALFDVASTASGQCWSLTSYCPVPGPVPSSPANNEYQPGFAAALMLKDLLLAQEASAAVGADTALGRHASDIYQRFIDDGEAGLDFSAIIEAIRQRSGGAA